MRWLAALALLSGCAMVTAEASFEKKALARVSFELSCPREQVKYFVVHRNDGLGCAGSQMAVTACGKKAVYICTDEQTWINNTAVAAP